MAQHVDFISPMLYPSSFQLGIPDYAYAVAYPYDIVLNSLNSCAQNSGLAPHRFRPWLQAFKDYGFDRRFFSARQIHEQIFASLDANSSGWMLWNAASRYNKDHLPKTE